jgi:hypothetical protein
MKYPPSFLAALSRFTHLAHLAPIALGALVACGSGEPSSTGTSSSSTTGGGGSASGGGGQGGASTTATTSGSGGQGGASTTSTGGGGSGGQGGSATTGSGGQGGTGGQEPLPTELCINELMPLNVSTLADEKGAYGDWIELHNPTDAAIDLFGWSITDDLTLPAKNPFPMGLSVPKKGFLLLWADEKVPLGPKHLGFKLAAGGGVVGLFGPSGQASVIPYGNTAADMAIAKKPDCCPSEACIGKVMNGTPGESNLQVPQVLVELVPVGSTYHYIDNGQPPPAQWTTAGYDDSALPSGPAPLGYGDAHIVTNVGFGPDGANKYTTTWFRATFDASGAATFTSATLDLMRDDGALVFLNGVEIARSNMPAGAILPSTFASVGATGAEETTFYSSPIDPSLFVEGKNVLTIELHQSSASSSDLGFDAKVSVKKPAP